MFYAAEYTHSLGLLNYNAVGYALHLYYLLNLTRYVPGYFVEIHKMGPIVVYYHVNTIGREFNWTRKD